MPWCEACSRYFTPTSMNADGTCPECGAALPANPSGIDEQPAAPWHFKLLVVAVVVYLGWRLLQLVGVLAMSVALPLLSVVARRL